jgi:2-methylisocitrate lyase-like PEP mutase family enzyme
VPLLVATVEEIARSVNVPVTVDVEGGYSSDPSAVADTVAAVIDAGGVGINIEDGTGDPDLLCAKIEQSKRASRRCRRARRGIRRRAKVPTSARAALSP